MGSILPIPTSGSTRAAKRSRQTESGFTLVELLVSSTVLLVMMGGLVAVLQVSQSLHNETQRGLELQQNVRAALNFISRELINAGSGIPYLTMINGSPPIQVPAGALLGPLGAAAGSGSVYFITPSDGNGQTVFKDGEGNDLTTPIHTDMLVFLGGMGDGRFVNQTPPGPTSGWGTYVFMEDNSIFRAGQVVLITNGFDVSLGQITQVLSNGSLEFINGHDPLNINSPGNGTSPNPNYYSAQQITGGPPPLAYPLGSITYFIDATTDPVHPCVKRLANSAGGVAAAATVSDDIENLQVSFLVDHDANATTPSISIDNPNTGQLSLVRGATVTITGRSRVKMGDRHYSDGHTRLTMSQTVFFRNNIRR